MSPNRYPQKEKLKKRKEIAVLFEKGKWKSKGNLRIIMLKNNTEINIENSKLGVSVSKRHFRKAVDRNRIKRLLRECYRLHKNIYHKAFGNNAIAMIFWSSYEMPKNFQQVEAEFISLCNSTK